MRTSEARFLLLLTLAVALLAAGPTRAGNATASEHGEKAETAASATPAPESAPATSAKASDTAPSDPLADLLSSMDRSVDPCQDFYRYACGGWLADTERPADQARWVRSFSTIRESNRDVVRSILEDAAAHPGRGGASARIGHFYAACMDEAAVAEAGTKPLAPWREKIAVVDDPASVMKVAGELFRVGVEPFFGAAVFADFKDPETNIAFLYQGGLGMPERDYYVSDEPAKKELMAGYQKHVAHMLGLLGEEPEKAAELAAAIVALETKLAEASRPAAEMRQMEKLYHKLDRAGLQGLTPELPWNTFFAAAGHPDATAINVATPEFFEALQPVVKNTPPEVLRAYLTWNLVNRTADRLPEPFVQADFDFFGKTLQGQPEIQPRWKRCVEATETALGEEVGKLYVERRFAGDSKQIALEMIGDIEGAFATALPELAWMDEATRKAALEKAEAVTDKIGYPDAWRDYSGVDVHPDRFFANTLAARENEFHFQMDKIGEPVDPKEWGMTPQEVNAYYNPLANEIVFPAGILQPPFFHRDFPAPMNYGAIGAVIGHELTHGFDDSGRKFDPEGRLREWWAPEVSKRFEERAQCVRDLYSGYQVEPGVHVQGDLTAGENIADIGGVKQAHAAYQRWEERHGAPELAGTDLTPEQLLFVAFGQVWCSLASPEFERMQVTTDSHSPARFRVIGPVSNNPAFAEAFACQPGAPMAPKQRCEVW